MIMEQEQLKCIIESALMAYGQPLTVEKLQSLFINDDIESEEQAVPEKANIQEALEAIQQNCEGRGFELKKVSSGWRFQVRADMAQWVNRLWDEKPQRYSRALLETLSIIAYRQPITRGDIEEIRGVAVSSHIIKTLTEREWVKVVGHRDVPGRPSLFATTRQFLDYFNLESLDELPSLRELADIDSLTPELDLQAEPVEPEANDDSSDADKPELSNAGEERENTNEQMSEELDTLIDNDNDNEVDIDDSFEEGDAVVGETHLSNEADAESIDTLRSE